MPKAKKRNPAPKPKRKTEPAVTPKRKAKAEKKSAGLPVDLVFVAEEFNRVMELDPKISTDPSEITEKDLLAEIKEEVQNEATAKFKWSAKALEIIKDRTGKDFKQKKESKPIPTPKPKKKEAKKSSAKVPAKKTAPAKKKAKASKPSTSVASKRYTRIHSIRDAIKKTKKYLTIKEIAALGDENYSEKNGDMKSNPREALFLTNIVVKALEVFNALEKKDDKYKIIS